MYPPSARDALLRQLEAEAALYGLSLDAFLFWAPYAEAVILAEGRPPNTDAANLAAGPWVTAMDEGVVYGAGLVYGRELLATMRALGATNDELTPTKAQLRAAAPLPDTEHAVKARATVARSVGVPVAEVVSLDRQLAALPQVRDLQRTYMAGVRNRMVDTPEVVFRAIAKDVDKGLAAGDHPSVVSKSVQAKLGTDAPDWPGRAMTVARTESAGCQSAATIEAALARNEILGEDLEQTWICTLDGKTRASHFAADGQRVKLGTAFLLDGHDVRFPGDPDAPAHLTINCRCRVAVLAADEKLPTEKDRHTERGPGDSTVINRAGSQADEIERRADEGTIRAREDPDGIGRTASIHTPQEDEMDPDENTSVELAEDETAEVESTGEMFRTYTDSVVAVLGTPTDDGRILASDIELSFREFPLPLMWTRQMSGGHYDAFTVGVIETARVEGSTVYASGYLLNTPEADEAADQLAHGVTGPSVDLGAATWIMTDVDGKEVTEEDYWDAIDAGTELDLYQTVTAAKLLGATLVSTPAFGETTLTLDAERSTRDVSLVAALVAADVEDAHAAVLFASPEFSGPTPLSIDADGRISGHLACFGTCHVGFADQCVTVPRSKAGYSYFHTSRVLTDAGHLAVGRLTVGTGHAAPRMGAQPAAAHYDDTGTCFALVRAGEDDYGVWVSGIAAPGATIEQVQAGLAAPLSGDWRTIGGNLELVAALAVNTPGFPVVSGATDDEDRPLALVASLGPDTGMRTATLRAAVDTDALADAVVVKMRAADRRRAEALAVIESVEVEDRKRRDETAAALFSTHQRRADARELINKIGV